MFWDVIATMISPLTGLGGRAPGAPGRRYGQAQLRGELW